MNIVLGISENGEVVSCFNDYDDDAELTENEEKAVEIIKKSFEKQGITFDVLFRRRSKDYLTLLVHEPKLNRYNDFCRIKVGIKSNWVSLDTSYSPKFAEDIRFINVKNKNCRHWKINLNGIDDFESVTDLIIADYQIITSASNYNFMPKAEKDRSLRKGKNIRDFVDDYVLFDIETTQLSIYEAKIIEISAIKIRNNNIVDKYDQLVNPGEIIPLDITTLTGITNEMVEGMPTIDEVLPKFLKFIGDDIIVGHNINSYDLNILNRYSRDLLDILITNDFVDTMDLARCLEELDVPNYRLSTLCDFWNIKNDNAHRAYSDVLANNECYQKMKEYTIGEYKSTFVKKEAKEFYFAEDITDKRICVTGDFKCGDRKVVTAKLKEYGAKVTATISLKTDYLLVGDLGTTTMHKFDDAAQFGTPVIYEKDFIVIGIDEIAKNTAALKETLFNKLLENGKAVVHDLDIHEKYLEVKMSEGNSQQAISVFLGERLCYRVVIQKRGYKVEMPKDIAQYVCLSQKAENNSISNYVTVLFDNIEDELLTICSAVLTVFLQTLHSDGTFRVLWKICRMF